MSTTYKETHTIKGRFVEAGNTGFIGVIFASETSDLIYLQLHIIW